MKIELNKNAEEVLKKRILRRSANGDALETPLDMFTRVAQFVAGADTRYGAKENEVKQAEERFLELMANLEFLPNSATLMNAGDARGQLSNCYVLPLEDSMESIFSALRDVALIHKVGAGAGLTFSNLRPKGDLISSTGRRSSGPLSFIRLFNESTNTVNEASMRRGALMGVMRVDHPDILDFITAKEKPGTLTNFNLSVAITDTFMRALERGDTYALLNPHDGKTVRKLKAKDVWGVIVDFAWKTADPGIFFIDEANRKNQVPGVGKIESTNVCGEQPLLPYESCNLGSINLHKMLGHSPGGSRIIDYNKLRRTVHDAVHFLDNVIDVNLYPLSKIENISKANRKIGLGVMGFADLLYALQVPYNSDAALKIGKEIMRFIAEEGRRASENLAMSRGSFSNFDKSVWSKQGYGGMRNAAITTVAPTGTISIIAGCSSGIEPIFALAYERKNLLDLGDYKMIEVHQLFKKKAEVDGFDDERLLEQIAKKGSLAEFPELPDAVRKVFVTAHDIAPEWHVKMQAAFQENTDSAVSKTVNLPRTATKEDVRRVFELAYKLHCKGVTIYRDHCKDKQVLNVGIENGDGDEQKVLRGDAETTRTEVKIVEQPVSPRERPQVVAGKTYRIDTGCGGMHVTIGEDEKGINEIIARISKSGDCARAQAEMMGRLLSIMARGGIDVEMIIKELRGIRCTKPCLTKDGVVLSCADALGRVLKKHIESRNKLI